MAARTARAGQRGLEDQGADDVGDHEKLEGEQDRPAEVGPQRIVRGREGAAAPQAPREDPCRQERAHQQHGDADELDDARGAGDEVLVAHVSYTRRSSTAKKANTPTRMRTNAAA